MHNSKKRHDAPKCHEDTRKAIIKDIESWVLDDAKGTLILWISTPAGSGKSAILQMIAELFQDSGGLAASFFFSRTAAQRQTEAHLIATIAAQLAVSIPATRPFIDRAVRDDLSIFDKTLPVQMKHLVIQLLICASLQAGRSSQWPSLLIIDGLNECRGAIRLLFYGCSTMPFCNSNIPYPPYTFLSPVDQSPPFARFLKISSIK